MPNATFFSTLVRSVLMTASVLLFVRCSSGSPRDYSIIEIVAPRGVISEGDMMQFCEAYKIESGSLYNWEDHWVLYIDKGRTDEIESRLKERLDRKSVV